jgi:hypothetical protein
VRRAIEFLTTRLLRSRLSVALALTVVVFGIVGAARLVSSSSDAGPGLRGAPTQPITTVDPTAGADGAISTGAPPSPTTSPGGVPPDGVARAFAAAWVAHTGVSQQQWHAALLPLSTTALTDKLAGVDPIGVPASRVTGEPIVIPKTAGFVEVTMPVDSGQLRLGLVARDGRWLVDTVDWARG